MFVVEELNNIEKYKKTKVKVLSSEILVAIPGKLGRKHFKTYLGLIDSGTSSYYDPVKAAKTVYNTPLK